MWNINIYGLQCDRSWIINFIRFYIDFKIFINAVLYNLFNIFRITAIFKFFMIFINILIRSINNLFLCLLIEKIVYKLIFQENIINLSLIILIHSLLSNFYLIFQSTKLQIIKKFCPCLWLIFNILFNLGKIFWRYQLFHSFQLYFQFLIDRILNVRFI